MEGRLLQNERTLKDFHELESLMSPINNFKNYNERVASRKAGQPIIPHFGIFLRDLTFLGENKASLGANDEGTSVDLEAVRMVGRKVILTQSYQSTAYKTSGNNPSLVQYLKQLQSEKDEDVLYQWSLKSEPSSSSGNSNSSYPTHQAKGSGSNGNTNRHHSSAGISSTGANSGSRHNSTSEELFDSVEELDDYDSLGSASSNPTGDSPALDADGLGK